MSDSLIVPGLAAGGLFSAMMNDLRAREAESGPVRPLQLLRSGKIPKPTKADQKKQKALARENLRIRNLPKAQREAIKKNPNGYGAPRLYKLRFTDLITANDAEAGILSNVYILFGKFGQADGAITLDGYEVPSECIQFNGASSTYSFHVRSPAPSRSLASDRRARMAPVKSLSGVLSFRAALGTPKGQVSVGDRTFNVTLVAQPISYSMDVSSSVGAVFITGGSDPGLQFDAQSTAWNDASNWETGLAEFKYQTYTESTPFGSKTTIENHFVDKASPSGAMTISLTHSNPSAYHSTLQAVPNGIRMDTIVDAYASFMLNGQVTHPAPGRETRAVKSVFPQQMEIVFDSFGFSYNGAYRVARDPNFFDMDTYAMKGFFAFPMPPLSRSPEGKEGDVGPGSFVAAISSLLADSLPAKDVAIPMPSSAPTTEEVDGAGARAAPNPNLNYGELLTMTPLNEDGVDVCFEGAMNDFYDIIVYHMEPDLRTTFVQKSPMVLASGVRQIADDSPDNQAFYRSLQAPYLTAALANSTVDGSGRLNAVRAQKMLQEIPEDSPIYQRQFKKLYRRHYLQKETNLNAYLTDQAQNAAAYSASIDTYDNFTMSEIDSHQVPATIDTGEDSTFATSVTQAKADVLKLAAFAKTKKCYWAMVLRSAVEFVSFDFWSTLQSTGQSGEISEDVKAYACLFGVLERAEDGAEGVDGISFTRNFLDVLRTWEMTAFVPMTVDLNGLEAEVDSWLVAILSQYTQSVTADPTQGDASAIQQSAIDAQLLLANSAVRKNLIAAMWASMAGSTVGPGVQNFILAKNRAIIAVSKSPWWLRAGYASSVLSTFFGGLGAVLSGIVLATTPFKDLNAGEKTQYLLSAVVTAVHLIHGLADLTGSLFRSLEARAVTHIFNGSFKKGLITYASSRLAFNFNLIFRKPSELIKYMGKKIGNFATKTPYLKNLFGPRFAVGALAVLALIDIVLSAIALGKPGQSKLDKAANSLSLLSGILSLAALAVSLTSFTATAAVLSFAAGALAVIGLILLLVAMFTQEPDITTPVEDLISTHLQALDLDMDETNLAIDYLLDLPPLGGDAATAGVTFKNITTKVPSNQQRYMALDNATGVVRPTNAVNYSDSNVWILDTNMTGSTFIATFQYVTVPPAGEGDPTTTANLLYLASNADGSAIELVQFPVQGETEANAVFNARVKCLEWALDITSSNRIDIEDQEADQLKEVTCTVLNRAKNKYLTALVGDATITGFGLSTQNDAQWKITREPKFQGNLQYLPSTWLLNTEQMGETIAPFWTPSPVSEGMTWSISPPLPEPFELLGAMDELTFEPEGTIRMKPGLGFDHSIPEATYTVTARATSPNGLEFDRTTTITIVVKTTQEWVAMIAEAP